MNTLTENQREELEKNREALTEKFIEQNKTILFDIGKVTAKGKQIREELNNLNLANELVKLQVKQQFDADVKKVKEFLGEYADAIFVSEDERSGNYFYSIGVNDDNKVYVTYSYGFDDWKDRGYVVDIDGHKYQKYEQHSLEINADGFGLESHADFEAMFNDVDVVNMFEIAMQDYIAYFQPKEKDFLNGIN
jgi:hypothetical protein